MKKLITIMAAIMILACFSTTAFALTAEPASTNHKAYFSIGVTCNSTTNYAMASNCELMIDDDYDVRAIYVYHNDDEDTEAYNNHFRALMAEYADNSYWQNMGAKWCTQGMKVPIQNNAIQINNFYTVSARGNTNYYDYDGVSRTTLSGHYTVNSSVSP